MLRLSSIAAFVLLACTAAATAHAQGVHVGFKLGPTFSSVADNISNRDFARRTGVLGYVFAEIDVVETFSLLAEAGYVQRGFQEQLREQENNRIVFVHTATTRFDYASFTALAKIHLPGGGLFRPYALLGPRVDVLVGRAPGSIRFVSESREGERYTSELAESYASTALGGSAAVGLLSTELFALPVLVELRLDADVTDSSSLELRQTQNYAFSLTVGVRL